jgi:hypothetical protein
MRRRRILKTKSFNRWALRAGLSDATVLTAVQEVAQGLIDGDLGGGVLKKRVGVPGRGKSGGARVVLATNWDDRWYFMFGFLKNQRVNISPRELTHDLLELNERQIDAQTKSGALEEVVDRAQVSNWQSNP